MANPELNPFVKANACQDCPTPAYNPIENAKLTCATPWFYPADENALNAAVQSCLTETGDGLCPTFAASNDATGNPYGVIGDWDVSRVTSLSQSTSTPLVFCCYFT